jgi:hypothetical protein
MRRRLAYAVSNGYHSVLLIDSGVVIGEWQVDDAVARDFLAATDADYWDATWPDATQPEDYGDVLDADEAITEAERIAGYSK